MALSAKPTKRPDVDVLAFIDAGGSVPKAAEKTAPASKQPQHPLKFPEADLFERLEKARNSGAVKLPRNTWVLQAIAEKLAREGF